MCNHLGNRGPIYTSTLICSKYNSHVIVPRSCRMPLSSYFPVCGLSQSPPKNKEERRKLSTAVVLCKTLLKPHAPQANLSCVYTLFWNSYSKFKELVPDFCVSSSPFVSIYVSSVFHQQSCTSFFKIYASMKSS